MYCASEVTTLWHYTNMFISTSVLWRCWLVDTKDIRPVKNKWWGAGMVICLEQGADLHMAQLMPLPLTLSCFSKIQIGFTFLVPAHLGSPRKGPLNRCVCVCFKVFHTVWLWKDHTIQHKHFVWRPPEKNRPNLKLALNKYWRKTV